MLVIKWGMQYEIATELLGYGRRESDQVAAELDDRFWDLRSDN